MDKSQAKDLFHLQTELVQMKVDMAVNRTIDRVIDQITNLRQEMHTEIGSLRNEMHAGIDDIRSEMHDLKNEMNNRFSLLDNRVIAIETKLGIVNMKRKGWYDRLMDLFFKAGWAWLSLIFAYLILHVK